MRIVVRENTIGDLAHDLGAIPEELAFRLPLCVLRNAKRGNEIAKGIARAKAGKHGSNYYKRLSAEMTGPLSAEYGPEGDPKTNFVGVGFRHGFNMDLPNSADIIGPEFVKDVGDEIDGAFW